MKKILIICSVFLCMFLVYNITHKEKVIEVNLKKDVFFNLDDYNLFYLNLEEENINTKNLDKVLNKDITIISIIPYVNPIYKDKIGPIKYKYENISYQRNINKLIEIYEDTIKSKGINDDLNYIKIAGLKINEIEIYAKGSDVINIMYSYRKIKYKNFLNQSYNYAEF